MKSNGSGKIDIGLVHKGGWVRVRLSRQYDLPEDIHAVMSSCLAKWFKDRPHLRLRFVVPIQRDGTTVEMHGRTTVFRRTGVSPFVRTARESARPCAPGGSRTPAGWTGPPPVAAVDQRTPPAPLPAPPAVANGADNGRPADDPKEDVMDSPAWRRYTASASDYLERFHP